MSKNAVFWDITSRSSCKNRRFGVKYHLQYHGEKTTLIVTITLILFAPIKEAILSTETSYLTTAMRRIPEDGILHSNRCENFKYKRIRSTDTFQYNI
jgi:hypothetical protein